VLPARTPEELDLLLEDAFVLRDGAALAQLFQANAVLVVGDTFPEARGHAEITAVAARIWKTDQRYISDPARIIQSGDIAFVTGPSSVSVARRGVDRSWRYAILLLSFADA
jgi:ketosteroid isomerase-like protein